MILCILTYTYIHSPYHICRTVGGADNPIAYVCLYARSEDIAEGLGDASRTMES